MKKLSPILLLVGLLAVAVGVLLPILTEDVRSLTFRYVYAVGAGLTLLARLFQEQPPKDLPVRVRRLLRLESWSSLMFCVAAFFAFYDKTQLRDWLAFTLAGATLQVYVTIALTIITRKKK